MARIIKNISRKSGLQPGSIVYIGKPRPEPKTVAIDVIEFNKDAFRRVEINSVDECSGYHNPGTISWFNINDIHNTELITKIGGYFNIHPLSLEDIANTGHRPKIEENDQYIFLIVKMLDLDENGKVRSEQLSIVIGSDYIISFQENVGDIFGPLRERLEKSLPRTRYLNADYLAYSLLDAVVDNYYTILEKLGEQAENLEDSIALEASRENLGQIHELRRELLYLRKAVWPLREVIGALDRNGSNLIHRSSRPYIRDLYEHAVQVIDTVEMLRDITSGLLEIYLSSIGNKTNSVMKVLTIIATIFIPLGFLAGVFGMNFNTSASPFNMPELNYKYGYPLFWLLVIIVGGGLLLLFKKKRWL